MHYRSRTRGLWHKGATSGNRQRVVALAADCDADTVLATVRPMGPACHTGATSCFGAPVMGDPLDRLAAVIAERAAAPEPVGYTGKLLADRNLRLKKLGEEAVGTGGGPGRRESAPGPSRKGPISCTTN